MFIIQDKDKVSLPLLPPSFTGSTFRFKILNLSSRTLTARPVQSSKYNVMELSIAMQPSHLSNPSSSNICVVCLNQFRKYKLVIFDSEPLGRDKLIGQQNLSSWVITERRGKWRNLLMTGSPILVFTDMTQGL